MQASDTRDKLRPDGKMYFTGRKIHTEFHRLQAVEITHVCNHCSNSRENRFQKHFWQVIGMVYSTRRVLQEYFLPTSCMYGYNIDFIIYGDMPFRRDVYIHDRTKAMISYLEIFSSSETFSIADSYLLGACSVIKKRCINGFYEACWGSVIWVVQILLKAKAFPFDFAGYIFDLRT